MESGTVHQIIQAHKRISSGNNNNEGTSGGAVSSIVSFPWPFHHRLISIIICSWLYSWDSGAWPGGAINWQLRRWQWYQQKRKTSGVCVVVAIVYWISVLSYSRRRTTAARHVLSSIIFYLFPEAFPSSSDFCFSVAFISVAASSLCGGCSIARFSLVLGWEA